MNPPESLPKTGVVICKCGNEVANHLDIGSLLGQVAKLPGVALVAGEAFACGKDGRARLHQTIRENKLERVLIAGCSPRLIEPLFKRCGQDAGLCVSDITTVNIREHCAYVHDEDRKASFEKARDLIAMGVARLANISQCRSHSGAIERAAAVVGAGLGAHTVALALAENDIPVKYIELDEQTKRRSGFYPDWAEALADEQACALKGHPNIQKLAGSRIVAVDGQAGQYHIDIKQGQEHICCSAGAVILVGDCGRGAVDVNDPAANEQLRVDRELVNTTTSFKPDPHLYSLSTLFQLPQDDAGYLTEPRIRLRPERYVDDGVFICGGAHQPTDANELLFQAYVVAGRVMRFLRQKAITLSKPVAEVDSSLCTGCGYCVQMCPTCAIRMSERDSLLSRADVDWTRCIGCGNCVVACPVKSLSLPEWDDRSIFAQIEAAFPNHEGTSRGSHSAHQPKIVVMACDWSAYVAADLAGSRRLSYPSGIRLIRLNCAARFDPMMALWAFMNGADGVLIGACRLDQCHYGSGNYYAERRVQDLKQQMADFGLDPRRVHLSSLSSDDGQEFATAVCKFAEEVKRVKVFKEDLIVV